MTLHPYLVELKRVLDDAAIPDSVKNMSREKLEAEIYEISEFLKGPLSDTDRLLLVEARQNRRNRIKQLDEAPEPTP